MSCPTCGGETRFSHREYAAKQQVRVVSRCVSCGTATAYVSDAKAAKPAPRWRKAPVDEGPPHNRVLDADLAKKLLAQLKESDDKRSG